MYDQASLYILTLQSSTMHPKAVNDIAFSIRCENVIGPRFVGATLWRLSSIYEPASTVAGNTLIFAIITKKSIWTGLYTYKLYLQTSPERWRLEGWLCSVRCSAIFQLRKNTIAPRQLFNKEGWKDIDGLALELATCAHSVYEAHLTPWTFGWGTTTKN